MLWSCDGNRRLWRNLNLFTISSLPSIFFTMDQNILIIKSPAGQGLLRSGRAHACGAKLLRLWVWFQPGAGLCSTSILSNVCLHRSLKEAQHCCFPIEKVIPRCAAWGKISLITVWNNSKYFLSHQLNHFNQPMTFFSWMEQIHHQETVPPLFSMTLSFSSS